MALVKPITKKIRGLFCLAAILSFCLSGSIQAAEKLHDFGDIKDPYLGVSLYYYYLGDIYSALTVALVSEKSKRYKNNDTEAKQLLAELYLNYGLTEEAEVVLKTIGRAGKTEDINDYAWLELANANYRYGRLKQAQSALDKIGKHLDDEGEAERRVLEARILLSQKKFEPATDILDRFKLKGTWGVYARYNLGIALLNLNNLEDGVAELNRIGKKNFDTDELNALKDQANLALGYLFLRAKEPEKAKTYLQRVRLRGAHSNRALLGIGWAHLALGEAKQALAPFLELNKRPAVDPAVMESFLAVPYAYAELEAYAQSLEQYEVAVSRFEGESKRIDKAIAALDIKRFLIDFSQVESGQEIDWLKHVPGWPTSPESRATMQLINKRWFREALRNYRELQLLDDELNSWVATLDIYDNMLGNRVASKRNVRKSTADAPTTIASLATSTSSAAYQRIKQKSQRKLSNNVKQLTKLRNRSVNLQPQVRKLLGEHSQFLREAVLEQLNKDKQRIETYLGQVRLHMAQIYDKVLTQ